jgi:hypothetical protein
MKHKINKTLKMPEGPPPSEYAKPLNSKKRAYREAFGDRDYEIERYGQEIWVDFFETHTGHGIYSQNTS